MGVEIFLVAVIILAIFAALDLIVGVSNDAANFLNSSIGSKVAPRYVIMIIASLGILAGVTFSSGMMEVARKSIFHPQFFTMPQLIYLFLAVMLADVILLDVFNSLGLPTSTTVSIVFELLGAAVAISVMKVIQAGDGLVEVAEYINSKTALKIILGILLSVAVAFVCGSVVQILSRLLLTFDYRLRLRRYGAIWGGVALTSITYFILVKGAKGASFISAERADWIQSQTLAILVGIFVAAVIVLQVLLFLRVDILKPIILTGTFALAMAFAANDLVNFIGVPMAGYHAYLTARDLSEPLTATMGGLAGEVRSETGFLLLAGAIMVVTLWLSKKARSVQATEVNLAQQSEREERFESTFLSRGIVGLIVWVFGAARAAIPGILRRRLARRLHPNEGADIDDEAGPSFDLVRAAVNLMVASAVISYATSYKLPLSTTYVTFMVAMGTSFADQAWGRDSAVYRVTGVLTVVGGWFMTAMLAFTFAGAFALVMFQTRGYGVAVLLFVAGFVLWRNHLRHSERARSVEDDDVFNLKKVADVRDTVSTTFEHMGHLVREIRRSLNTALGALFVEDEDGLRQEAKRAKKVQRWTNIITANIFKALRLLQRESVDISYRYPETARRLQKMADGHRDIVVRAYMHVSNHHKGLLSVQIDELKKVRGMLLEILSDVESTITKGKPSSLESVATKEKDLRDLAEKLHEDQIVRIRDGDSKTRLSILFYAIVGNALMLSKQSLRLLNSFEQSFSGTHQDIEFDLE